MHQIGQEKIVILIATLAILIFSLVLPNFLELNNLVALARNISILGVFSLGMAVVLIGRGIDLSQTAIGLIAAAITIYLLNYSDIPMLAFIVGLLCALFMGILNASLITIFQIPPLFATLASAVLFVGLGRTLVLDSMIIHLPDSSQELLVLGGQVGGIPIVFLCYLLLAILVHIFLQRTVPGRFIYALGANPRTATKSGLPIRRLVYLQYILSALIGYLGGLLIVATTGMVDLKSVGTGMIFEILMVVILGGISLSGGKGSVISILAGTLLIGVLLNGMTLLDLGSQIQNLIKGIVLLSAITLDGWLSSSAREEQIQQGV